MKAFCYTWSTRLAIIAIVSALSTLPVKADLREGLVGLWLFDDGADKDIEVGEELTWRYTLYNVK